MIHHYSSRSFQPSAKKIQKKTIFNPSSCLCRIFVQWTTINPIWKKITSADSLILIIHVRVTGKPYPLCSTSFQCNTCSSVLSVFCASQLIFRIFICRALVASQVVNFFLVREWISSDIWVATNGFFFFFSNDSDSNCF